MSGNVIRPVYRIREVDGLHLVEQAPTVWIARHMTLNLAEAERAVEVLAKTEPGEGLRGQIVAEYDAQGRRQA